jgi:glycosyltransferase involved in cell wall biosynthesis
MDWYIAAPFIHSVEDPWLTSFIPNTNGTYHSVPAAYQHDRSRKSTGMSEWADYFKHASRTWKQASGNRQPSGIVTCFPQLPLAVGLHKKISRRKIPLVAWTFNVGSLPSGVKRRVAISALSTVDKFIVHSSAEIATCSEWLELPESRFKFVPLQRAIGDATLQEDQDDPFVLSMGSAQRDYRLLFDVVAELKYRTLVIAAPHAVAGLRVPENVEIRAGLSITECHELIQRARVNVIPVANIHTASGQVTLVDAMMYGRAAVITSCPASVDYVEHERDGWLVRAGDRDDMKTAIQRLWEDSALRFSIGNQARKTVVERFSDPAVGKILKEVLEQFETR